MFYRTAIASPRSLRAAFVLSVAATSVAFAAGEDSIDQIVVTATRAPAALSSIGESVTVIDSNNARASQKTVVSDLLATSPGVVVNRNGGLGGTTSVRIRGAETDQTLVLIDGVKLNDPASVGGAYDFANLLVNDVARIEVLRGAQSTLWGSQAIGGVINVVTPEPSGPLEATIDVQGGAFNTARSIARAQAGSETFGWRVGADYLTSDGISAFDEDLGGREEDGYRQVGLNARGYLRLTDAVLLEARSNWSRARHEFDGFAPPTFSFGDTADYGRTIEWVSYAGVKIDTFSQTLQHRIGIAYTDTDRVNYDPASSVPKTFDGEGASLRYEYQATAKLGDRVSGVFGLEREHSKLATVAPSTFEPNPTPLDRDVVLDSAYALLQINPADPLTLSAGLRYDDHETFGDDTSAQVALAWSLTQATVVRASYGEGFKAPTLYQLYSPYGTRTLTPEESTDWDISIEQRLLDDKLAFSATYFERDTESMIDFVSCWGVLSPRCAAQPDGYYENLNQTRADGFELGLTAQLAELRFDASYTSLDARNNSRESFNFGKVLPRRPRDTAAASLTYAWPVALTTTLAAQYVGRNFDDAANTSSLDDYTLVDFRAAYRASETLEIYGRIENLFDRDYMTARNYGTLGRAGYVGVRVTLR